MALRRGYNDRRAGSIQFLAEWIYEIIQSGSHNLTKALNLNRPLAGLHDISVERLAELESERFNAEQQLFNTMDVSRLSPADLLTGLVITPATCPW
jgi:hypothetical protein